MLSCDSISSSRFFSQKVHECKKTTTHLNLDSSNNGISASVNVIGQHLELAGEHRDLPELLFLLLHDVRLVFSKPGGDILHIFTGDISLKYYYVGKLHIT